MALKETDLGSSVGQLDGLWQAVDKVRSTSRTVTVDKAALTAMLLDHTRMAEALFGQRPRIGLGRG